MTEVKMRPLDFRIIRMAVRPIDVLLRMGWTPRYHCGSVYRGGCPVHRSTSRSSRSLVCNGGVWYCHKCRAGGDAVRLVALLRGISDLAAAHAICDEHAVTKPYLH